MITLRDPLKEIKPECLKNNESDFSEEKLTLDEQK